jgi:hypothetical protein
MADGILQGPTVPLTWDGKTYQLGMLDQDGKEFFEQWCKEQAYEELLRLEESVKAGKVRVEHYTRLQDRYCDQVFGKGFAWGGVLWQHWIDSRAGRAKLMHLALARRYRDFSEQDATALYDSLPPREAARLTTFILQGPPDPKAAPAPARPAPASA